MRIGILALQGAFAEHSAILQKLGADSFEIRQKRDLAHPMDGLIIPGGESTVMGKLLKELDCYDEVRSRIENGLPVFGTCAGLILLAKEAEGGKVQLGTMDIVARRQRLRQTAGQLFHHRRDEGRGRSPHGIHPCALYHFRFRQHRSSGRSGRQDRGSQRGQPAGYGVPSGTDGGYPCAWLFPAHGGRGKGVTCSKR